MGGTATWGGLVRRVLVWTLGLGFVALILCVSIPPLSDWTQELGSCRGAETIERDVQDAGTVTTRGPGGGASTSEISTTTFTLRCTYEDGEVRLVENDPAVLRGFGVAFLLGVTLGLVVALAMQARDVIRTRERPPAQPPDR